MHAPIIATLMAFALLDEAAPIQPVISIHGEPASPRVKLANRILLAVQAGHPRSLAGLVTPGATIIESFSAPEPLTSAALAKVLSACRPAENEYLEFGKDWVGVTMLCPIDRGGPRYSHFVQFDYQGSKVSAISFIAKIAAPG